MSQVFSKENQSPASTAYRFGDFELHPSERLLKKKGSAVPLQPKSFDTLLCLVSRAAHLVSKQELTNILWPDVHVAEANLTNIIVSLRKVLGRDAIRTVSKHGYRFELPVSAEPGVALKTYARFTRARQLSAQRSLETMSQARDLLLTCLAEDPGFAPAWAYLGRCYAFLEKFGVASTVTSDVAPSAFKRAFALDPDLACAHQFYTFTQVDCGHAVEAVTRLLTRLERHPGEIESLAGLVQAFRFCGLLEESMEAHRRAIELDPTAATGVPHTLFLCGDYASAIEAYSGQGTYYVDAAALAALGDRKRAVALIRKRLTRPPLSKPLTALMSSLLAVLEGKAKEAVRIMDQSDQTRDPEILVYLARHYAKLGKLDAAITTLHRSADLGFTCAPTTLRRDPWFHSLQKHRKFASLLRDLDVSVQQARALARSFRHHLSTTKNEGCPILARSVR